MSLPSSGALSIGQIYQECGGTANTADEDILRVRDNWWYADLYVIYTIQYDDNNGFAQVIGNLTTYHAFRETVDVDVTYEIGLTFYNGFNWEFQPYGNQTIYQYGSSMGTFYVFYNCYQPYSCWLDSAYTTNATPPDSGNYLYSTTFSDYYGKTRYNQYVAL